MPRRALDFGSLVTVTVLFTHAPLHAQPVFSPDTELGPYAYQATLTLSGVADDEFGRNVAISGDVALVAGSGIVYVFERDPQSDIWEEVAPITPAGPVEGFGRSLAIDKRTAIIGAQGSAHLFRRGARGRWREIATLVPSDGHLGFGVAVGIAGSQAIVGAVGLFDPDLLGAAYVFRRRQGNDWRETAILRSASSGTFSRSFGASVSISEDTATVTEVGPSGGAASIFSRTDGANDDWIFVRRFLVGGVFMGPAAVQRDTAVYGAGEIQAFAAILGRNIDGPNGWGVEATFTSSEGACCGTYRSVAVDGDRIILGLGGVGTGVDILSRHEGGADVWGRIARFRDAFASTPRRANLGASVSVSGDTTLLSAPGASNDPTDNAVHVFVSDLDGDGLRDGIDPCVRDPLNNVSRGCQRASAEHPVLDDLIAQGDVTAETDGRRHVINATFTNTSTTAVKNPFFEVIELTGGNVLLNADGGRGGIGATLSPDVGDGLLSPSESMTASFEIRLRSQKPFQFRVTLHGDPIASPATLVVDANGILTGATGVVVNGQIYDVEFVDGTFAEVFDGCGQMCLPFLFQPALALAASQALLDQVFGDGPSPAQLFDSNPSLTNGCSSVFSCSVITPHSRSTTGLSTAEAINNSSIPPGGGSPNYDEALFSAETLNYDSALDIDGTFARWTLRQP